MEKHDKTQKIIQELRDTICRSDPNAEVILYGSQARGDARPNSDIDLLIIVNYEKLTLEKEQKITFPLYGIELASGIVISPMVVSLQTP